jgi:hypothetical protein
MNMALRSNGYSRPLCSPENHPGSNLGSRGWFCESRQSPCGFKLERKTSVHEPLEAARGSYRGISVKQVRTRRSGGSGEPPETPSARTLRGTVPRHASVWELPCAGDVAPSLIRFTMPAVDNDGLDVRAGVERVRLRDQGEHESGHEGSEHHPWIEGQYPQ